MLVPLPNFGSFQFQIGKKEKSKSCRKQSKPEHSTKIEFEKKIPLSRKKSI
jgi:hypothetical protein